MTTTTLSNEYNYARAVERENNEVADYFANLVKEKRTQDIDDLEMTLTVFASKKRTGTVHNRFFLEIAPSCKQMIERAIEFHKTVPNSTYLARLEEELFWLETWVKES